MQSSALHVAKFGGTSLADYEAMKRCAQIVKADPNIRLVVVSAPSGVTNTLVQLSQLACQQDRNTEVLLTSLQQKVECFLTAITPCVELKQRVQQLLEDIKLLSLMLSKAYSKQLVDELLSFGERLSAQFFTAILAECAIESRYVDARHLLTTDSQYGKANPILPQIRAEVTATLLPELDRAVHVTEGFIGSDQRNITITLGRGGGDYSAALFAEALSADAVQIWTDVNGIYRTDPRIVPSAQKIDHLCFSEAAELATFGAKVLHPASLWPAIRQNIPVYVGSSFDAEAGGTWISKTSETPLPTVRAIAMRRQQVLLTIHSLEMFHARGFLAQVFEIFSKHHIGIDLITTSEVSIAVTLDNAAAVEEAVVSEQLLIDLRDIGNIRVEVEMGLNLIAVIGNCLQKTAGVSGQVFQNLQPFNIRLLCHGASQHNLCFLVDENEGEKIVQSLHTIFFDNQ